MFMRVVDLASMVVNATVNQTDMDLLRVGARARVRFDAYPDLELPGRVHAIAAMSRSGGFRPDYVREIPVVIKLERLDPRVVPDLSVSVDVVLESEPGGVRVPREAIFTGPAGGGHYVYVRGAAGWERRSVELGLTNNVAAIVRTGVRPQETVALGRPPMEQAAARR
jgi:HlyD family secretion protein